MSTTPLRIRKNATQEVRLDLTEYQGHQLANLRVWWTPDRGATWHPSTNGFALHVARLPELLNALATLETIACDRGLLDHRGGPAPAQRAAGAAIAAPGSATVNQEGV